MAVKPFKTEAEMSLSSNRAERGFVYFKALEYEIEIGIHDFEQGKTQRFSMDVDVEIDPALVNKSENISEVFDYDRVKDLLDRLAQTSGFKLQETYCRTAAEQILALEGAMAVRIKTAKLDVYDNAGAIGLELYLPKNVS